MNSVAYANNPKILQSEVRGLWVQGQPELRLEVASKNKGNKNKAEGYTEEETGRSID